MPLRTLWRVGVILCACLALGALCGFWLYLLLRRLAPKFTQRFQVEVRYGRETGDPKPAP